MNTPIVDFVKSYESKNALQLHMPGHKGKTFLGLERHDITEIDGADVLYSPDGIIEESENNASALFGTRHTYYSTEGSSLCIRAMVYLACLGKEKPLIIAGRNVHKAFIYAAALCDCEVKW
ncbi:MAG: amino acid decarboxylase, partial [Clostridia bacterium]|nr:amino acid decarboxylase [Clostridia bacterium]